LFGGQASWGIRQDIDPLTRPSVLADAWLSPFVGNSFDVVILDPPYFHLNQQMKTQLIKGAAFIARQHIIWFHTLWIGTDSGVRLERAVLVRVGDMSHVRCIQVFRSRLDIPAPTLKFTRGPALRYNRWLNGQMLLPGTRIK
jgi:hypothetical protein